MNDQEFDEQKARVVRFMEKWKAILPLGTWLITPHFYRDGMEKEGNRDAAVARCEPDWRYLHAKLSWNMPLVQHYDDHELENFVVHEYVHILLDCLVSYAVQAEGHEGARADKPQVERTTSELTLAILWAHQASVPATPAVTAEPASSNGSLDEVLRTSLMTHADVGPTEP